ncbi:MAG: hypothetical protein AAF196_12780 [Planctomycetota bacterium]
MLAVIQLFMVVVSLRVGWAFGSELQQSLGVIGWILGIVPGAWINYTACERVQKLLLTCFAPNETITSGDLREADSDPTPSTILGPRRDAPAIPFAAPSRSIKPGFFRTLGILILVALAISAFAIPAAVGWVFGCYGEKTFGPLLGWLLGTPAGYALGFVIFQLGEAIHRRILA